MYKDDFPIRALALAVIQQAIKDYVAASKKMDAALRSGNPRRIAEADYGLREIERFFKSQWCATLCDGVVDGNEILQKLKNKEWRFDREFGYVLCGRRTRT